MVFKLASENIDQYHEREGGTFLCTLSDLAYGKPLRDENELVGDIQGRMELARGIEPPTGGLQILEETDEEEEIGGCSGDEGEGEC